MTKDDRIDDLLDRWEAMREQGVSISPEELCKDCPELLDTVKGQIEALRWLPSPDTSKDERQDLLSFSTHDSDGRPINHPPAPKTLGRYDTYMIRCVRLT